MNSKLKRLSEILAKIESMGNHASNSNIDRLETLIHSEKSAESNFNPDFNTNSYLSNLKDTEYELITLLENINKPENREYSFRNVIMHFKQDLTNEIYRIKSSEDI